ncbi:MAG: ABC transporter substrate-binding protein [Deltaproteobacteria bacterium]|nr:ABC transporter substrate-binding protein [Deltaproteobacteria bacterium]
MYDFRVKIWAVTVILSLTCAALSNSKEVSAIKSMDILPYKEAVNGFRETVDAEVSEYILSSDSDYLAIVISKNRQAALVFTLGTDALRLVKDELRNVPVVYTFVLNADSVIGAGRSNITGIDMNIPPEEQFNALLQVVPSARRIGVIYEPSKSQSAVNEAEAAAGKLGVHLISRKVKTGAEAINAINQLEGTVDALWMLPDTTAITPESVEYMLLFSFKNRIPLIGISEKYVKNGALFALTFDSEDMGRQAGEIATRILMGEDASNITIPKPRKLRLSINLNTAEKLGLNIPEKVVGKAAKVFR